MILLVVGMLLMFIKIEKRINNTYIRGDKYEIYRANVKKLFTTT